MVGTYLCRRSFWWLGSITTFSPKSGWEVETQLALASILAESWASHSSSANQSPDDVGHQRSLCAAGVRWCCCFLPSLFWHFLTPWWIEKKALHMGRWFGRSFWENWTQKKWWFVKALLQMCGSNKRWQANMTMTSSAMISRRNCAGCSLGFWITWEFQGIFQCIVFVEVVQLCTSCRRRALSARAGVPVPLRGFTCKMRPLLWVICNLLMTNGRTCRSWRNSWRLLGPVWGPWKVEQTLSS